MKFSFGAVLLASFFLHGCSTVTLIDAQGEVELQRILDQHEIVTIRKKSNDVTLCHLPLIEDENIICQAAVETNKYPSIKRIAIRRDDIAAIEKRELSIFKTFGAGIGIILISTVILLNNWVWPAW